MHMSIQITSLEANLVLHREQLAMKDVQLRRLEEEIGNAHRCVRLVFINESIYRNYISIFIPQGLRM